MSRWASRGSCRSSISEAPRTRAGHELRTTQIAVADEIAGAAELVLGKARQIPAAIVRGVEARGDGSAAELVMPRDRDLFR